MGGAALAGGRGLGALAGSAAYLLLDGGGDQAPWLAGSFGAALGVVRNNL